MSEGAVSPDGDEVVYRVGNDILVATVNGAAPIRTLMPGRFAGWGNDGHIYVSTDVGLDRIPAQGGEPQRVTRLADGELIHRFSDALPGGILIEVTRGGTRGANASLDFVDLSSGQRTRLVDDAIRGRWVDNGLLLYLSDGVLTVDDLDLDTRTMAGQPVSLLTGVGQFVLADDGRLVYAENGNAPGPLELVWVSRTGQEVAPVREGWYPSMDGVNLGWTLSPDDRYVLLGRWLDGNRDIWTLEIATGELRRLTDRPAQDFAPRWSPDGSEVVFPSDRIEAGVGPFALWSVPSAGGQAPRVLFGDRPVALGTWRPDGDWLVVRTTTGPQGGGVVARDILAVRPGTDSMMVVAADPDAEEAEPEFSRDGRWIAYTSNHTGRTEVFVQPFPPSGGARWPVSLEGGIMPYWSKSGDELLFVQPDTRQLTSVRFDESSPTFTVVSREVLFSVPPEFHLSSGSDAYDESADGLRFLMARRPEDAPPPAPRRLFVIDHWLQDVERRVAR